MAGSHLPLPDPGPGAGTADQPDGGERDGLPIGAWVSAAVLVVVLVAVSGRYGYHRDELYFLESGHHLAWGEPDNPVGVPLLAQLWTGVVGDGLTALRVLPALVSGAAVLVGALTCRALGGSRHATLVSAVATACLSIVAGTGHLFSTTTFDLALTATALLLLVRALDEPARLRRWVALGLVTGAAMEVKVLIALVLGSALVGLLVLGPRRPLTRPGPYLTAAIAVALAAPYLVWQARRGWPMAAVAADIAAGGSTSSASRALVVPLSLLLMGPLLCLVGLLGLVTSLRRSERRRWGWIGLGYLMLVAVVPVTGGKPYYLAGYFPLLVALGARPLSGWLQRSRRREHTWWVLVAVFAVPTAVFDLPLSPVGSFPFRVATAVNPDGAETVGWAGYVATVRDAAAALPPEQRAETVVLAHNYGEAGALALAHRTNPADAAALPPVYSGHNAFAEWGPPPESARTVLVVGEFDPGQLPSWFDSCRPVARLTSPPGVDNEEDGVPVAVCTGLRRPWAELWPAVRRLA